jgi:anhydro-N-acetylmuramic acid kinase
MPYQEGFRVRLAEACRRAMAMDKPGFEPLLHSVEEELTELHVEAVSDLLARSGHIAEDIAVIGFHGHTVAHRPEWSSGSKPGLSMAMARRQASARRTRNPS